MKIGKRDSAAVWSEVSRPTRDIRPSHIRERRAEIETKTGTRVSIRMTIWSPV